MAIVECKRHIKCGPRARTSTILARNANKSTSAGRRSLQLRRREGVRVSGITGAFARVALVNDQLRLMAS